MVLLAMVSTLSISVSQRFQDSPVIHKGELIPVKSLIPPAIAFL